MGLKEEFKREMRNVKNEAAKEIEKHIVVDFEGHRIEIMNKMMEEMLVVDGKLVDQGTRKSIWSYVRPFSKLSGEFTDKTGKVRRIHVKIGGLVKLNITVKVDGATVFTEAMKLTFLPWSNKEYLAPFIEQHMSKHHKMVSADLPDDAFLYDEHHPKLLPGLGDQLVDESVPPFYTKKLIKLLMEQIEHPSDKTRKATYEKLKEQPVISYFHELVEHLSMLDLEQEAVKQEVLWLYEHAAHREVLKFAVILLGFTGCENEQDRLQMLALHEEFTGVALFALKNGTPNANHRIWLIAQKVCGWGKLEALNFLEPDTADITAWFITDGMHITVRKAQAALMCAEKGSLDVLLHEAQVTAQQFAGASHILQAMLQEDGQHAIATYAYTGQVVRRYLYHAKKHCQTLEQFYVVTCIYAYLDVPEEQWQERYDANWKPHERREALEAMEVITQNSAWREEALAIFHSDNPNHVEALAILLYYQYDVVDVLLEKLEKMPNELNYHFVLISSKKQQAIEGLVKIAQRFETFDQLTEAEQDTIELLLDALKEYAGVGIEVIEKALRSNVEDLQYLALYAITTRETQQALTDAIAHVMQSKNKELKQIAKDLV